MRPGFHKCLGAVLPGAALAVLTALALPVTAQGGDGPGVSVQPIPRPDPLAEWRAEQRDAAEARRAFEREEREDWLDWQRDRGGTYNRWRSERREAERELDERRRKDQLERRQPAPRRETPSLGQRLEEQWQRQLEISRERTPAERLRPDRPGPPRPGPPRP